jgi:hypothetical protein
VNADVLTSLLRSGAREQITKAVQSELAKFLSQYQDMTDNQGISTGGFSETLATLLGKNAKGLSAGKSAASNNVGLMSMMIGEQEASRKRAMFISGEMVFTSTSGVMMQSNAFWLLLA